MKKMMKGKKGISTILAALLLVVIVVVASVIVYAWATGLFGGLMPSSPSVKEGLSMDSYTWGNATGDVTLFIRNVGTVDVTLESYYIEEAGQTLGGPTDITVNIGVNTVEPVDIAYVGWQSGHSYSIKLITSRGTQFAFTVIAA